MKTIEYIPPRIIVYTVEVENPLHAYPEQPGVDKNPVEDYD